MRRTSGMTSMVAGLVVFLLPTGLLQAAVLTGGDGWQASFSGPAGFRLEVDPGQRVDILPVGPDGSPGAFQDFVSVPPGEESAAFRAQAVFADRKGDARVLFRADGLLTFEPGNNIVALRFTGDLRYGMVPGFFLEDLIYPPEEVSGGRLYLPAEHVAGVFMGDGQGILWCAWPQGEQRVRLLLDRDADSPRIAALEIVLDGRPLHVGLLAADGLWHALATEETIPGREITPAWERPFEALWRTQLSWNGIESFFLFASGPQNYGRWQRAYPVWFEDDGRARIYLREERAAFLPSAVRTIVYPFKRHPQSLFGFIERTPLRDSFADIMRPPRAFEPSDSVPDVGFTACHGTELLRETLITAGIQDREHVFLQVWLDLVLNENRGTHVHRERYGALTERLAAKVAAWQAAEQDSDTRAWLALMAEAIADLEPLYQAMIAADGQESSAGYIAYGKALAERMRTLMTVPGTEYIAELNHIVTSFNRIVWAARETTEGWHGGGYGHQLRERAFQAGYTARYNPDALAYAEKLRAEIREFLSTRNSDVTTVRGSGIQGLR